MESNPATVANREPAMPQKHSKQSVNLPRLLDYGRGLNRQIPLFSIGFTSSKKSHGENKSAYLVTMIRHWLARRCHAQCKSSEFSVQFSVFGGSIFETQSAYAFELPAFVG
jgi:hypothetical protein